MALARAFLGGLADPKGVREENLAHTKTNGKTKGFGQKKKQKKKSSKQNGERESRDRVR